MRSVIIIEVKVGRQASACLFGRLIIVQIDLLILDRAQGAPAEAFRENVVQGAAFAIHTDLHIGRQEPLGVLWTGEMTALITIPDERFVVAQGTIDCL